MVMHGLGATSMPAPGVGTIAFGGRASMRDRMRAHFGSGGLDRALADGAPSHWPPALALRARQIVAPPARRSIAAAYLRIVRDASYGARRSRVQVNPLRARVAAAGDELSGLAAALEHPGPVAAQGVAQALLLLVDGTGPLYNPESAANLAESAFRATANLELSRVGSSG
jgi:hypothetical protein